MKPVYPDIAGVILAGGHSSRFGKNKAFARFEGVPFIQRIIATIQDLFPDLLLVTNTPEQYQHLPIKVMRDDVPHQGPLGGIATALRQTTHEKIFVIACDMPLLNPDDIQTLVEHSNTYANTCDATIALSDSMPAYLMALYARSLLAPIETYLQSGQRSLKDFCRTLSNVAWVPLKGSSTININTEQDLRHLETKHAV
jgi:molybdopterin-guanine dinucleotide biosynthesis protein A